MPDAPETRMIREPAECKLDGEDMAHAIDTLRITRKLESAGVDRRQAEAHAEALNEVVVTEYSELATKTDLARFPTTEEMERFAEKFATREDLERYPTKEHLHEVLKKFATKEELKAELAQLETRMFRLWAVSTVTLATLIVSMPFVAG